MILKLRSFFARKLNELELIVLVKGPFLGLRQFQTTESSSNIMENAFCFMSKALFIIKIFMLLSWHSDYVENRLVKIKLISKFLAPQAGQQIMTIITINTTK